jgi:enoyl-CoA hydratase
MSAEPISADTFTTRADTASYETETPVLYAVSDGVATVTMNRPDFNNAQNSQMTYALDAAFRRAVDDDSVRVIVLRGAGRHFSAGHDIGTPGRDVNRSFERTHLWWDHTNKPGAEFNFAREQEVYLGMCRRWRAIPKPTIAMVQGACVAGGLMLAWVCDLIVASDDAFFQDPVVRMGIPGVEYFAHAHELHPRIAKEFLFLGERMPAARAESLGMVNKVVPRAQLDEETARIAARIATQPRMGLALTKQVINAAEDLQGLRATMEMAYGYHHVAHAHGQVCGNGHLGGYDARAMASANKEAAGGAVATEAAAAVGTKAPGGAQ